MEEGGEKAALIYLGERRQRSQIERRTGREERERRVSFPWGSKGTSECGVGALSQYHCTWRLLS
jgi:hypothetical protein